MLLNFTRNWTLHYTYVTMLALEPISRMNTKLSMKMVHGQRCSGHLRESFTLKSMSKALMGGRKCLYG